jgi:uncharacterized protein (TIGR02145 family)
MRNTFSKIALAAGFLLALAFTFSCSGGDDLPNGGNEPSYGYCIKADNTCLTGPFTASTCNGQLSNNCPYSSNTTPSSSSHLVSSSSVQSSSSVCTASDNTAVQYCSNGTMKQYGSVADAGGKTYKTVIIGTQTWMAKNLDFETPEGSKCYYNDDANCEEYGRLYIWSTAMSLPQECNSTLSTSDAKCAISAKHRGVCPDGWHVPSGADWNALMKFANPSCLDDASCDGAGTKLMSVTGWNPANGVPVDADDFGFAALLGGGGLMNNSFGKLNEVGYWWSASENNALGAYAMCMAYNSKYTVWGNSGKHFLFSVRCLED